MVEVHYCRLDFIDEIVKLIPNMNLGLPEEAKRIVKEAISKYHAILEFRQYEMY